MHCRSVNAIGRIRITMNIQLQARSFEGSRAIENCAAVFPHRFHRQIQIKSGAWKMD